MQTGGTSIASRSFCRRASRNKAAGRKTEGADVFFLSRIEGIVPLSQKVGQRSPRSDTAESQSDARALDDSLRRPRWFSARIGEARFRAARFAQDGCFLARSWMPIHDGEFSARV